MSYNNAYGINEDGKLAVRVIGVGGGGQTIRNQDKTITENGIYTADSGYTGLGTVTVNVPTPTRFRAFDIDQNGKLIASTTETQIMDFTGVKTIGDYMLYGSYRNNTAISGIVDMSDLESIEGNNSCQNAFSGCVNITGFRLDSLKTINGYSVAAYMFRNDVGITLVDLGNLETISGNYACYYMFSGDANITSVIFTKLKVINGMLACQNMFEGCVLLESLSFPAITTASFAGWTNQFSGLCQGIPNITLHFPSNVQSVIEGLVGYSTTAPFGATAGTVLFDLPATE